MLFSEGTAWEHKKILPSENIRPRQILAYSWIKRCILAIPTICILLFLKNGFTTDFMNYVMTALSIFIGLFTNLIIILYQRFPKKGESQNVSHQEAINTIKIKNFIRQFTFVTGKNLLIATIVIVLLSVFMLFKSLATLNFYEYTFVEKRADVNAKSFVLFTKCLIAVPIRLLIIYGLIDFSLLLLYSLGSLFSFLKGEYK